MASELDGLVAGRAVGRTRLFRLNPSYLAKRELAAYLAKEEAEGVRVLELAKARPWPIGSRKGRSRLMKGSPWR